jgi:hypothetical protein
MGALKFGVALAVIRGPRPAVIHPYDKQYQRVMGRFGHVIPCRLGFLRLA